MLWPCITRNNTSKTLLSVLHHLWLLPIPPSSASVRHGPAVGAREATVGRHAMQRIRKPALPTGASLNTAAKALTTTTVTLTYCIKSSAALHVAGGFTPGVRFLYLVRRDQYIVQFLQLWQIRQDLLAVVRL